MLIVIKKSSIDNLIRIDANRDFQKFVHEYNEVYKDILFQTLDYINIDKNSFTLPEHKRLIKSILIVFFSKLADKLKTNLLYELLNLPKETNPIIAYRKSLIILLKVRMMLVNGKITESDENDLKELESSVATVWNSKLYYQKILVLFYTRFKVKEELLTSALESLNNMLSVKMMGIFVKNTLLQIISPNIKNRHEVIMRFLSGQAGIKFDQFNEKVSQNTQIYINKLICYKQMLENGSFSEVIFSIWD